MNAMAHSLQALLYTAGPSAHESAQPLTLVGENYRANPIESADTQFLRVHTAQGPVLEILATHACQQIEGPLISWELEEGRIEWSALGRVVIYQKGVEQEVLTVAPGLGLDVALASTLESLKTKTTALCTIDNSWQHVACVEALFGQPVVTIPPQFLKTEQVQLDYSISGAAPGTAVQTSIVGIDEAIRRGWLEGRSFFELGQPWAVAPLQTELSKGVTL
jgi:hypothetical protein